MKLRMDMNELELIMGIDIPTYSSCLGTGKNSVTEAQKAYLHDLGVNTSGILCKAQACAIIDALLDRQKKGLASLKQIVAIRNMNVRIRKPFQFLTYNDAGKIIARYL